MKQLIIVAVAISILLTAAGYFYQKLDTNTYCSDGSESRVLSSLCYDPPSLSRGWPKEFLVTEYPVEGIIFGPQKEETKINWSSLIYNFLIIFVPIFFVLFVTNYLRGENTRD